MTLGLWVDGKLAYSTKVETKPSGLVYFNPYSEERIRVPVPEGDHTLRLGFVDDPFVKTLAKETDADYVICVERRALSSGGFFRLPRQGPILTWRAVCDEHMPALADWDLTMGDVELF